MTKEIMSRTVLVIGDGIADRPLPELGGKTPLQYACLPTLEAICKSSELGLCRTIPDGIPAGSDTAFLSIFGYDPREVYKGRSPLEAAGMGIMVNENETAFRCNIVSIENGIMRSHNGGQIEGKEAAELMNCLTSNEKFTKLLNAAGMKIHISESFRHLAVMSDFTENPDFFQSSQCLLGADSDDTQAKLEIDPPHDFLDSPISEHIPKGRGAEILWELTEAAHKIMDAHPINDERRKAGKLPANGIWLWGAGRQTALKSFETMYGRKGTVISAVPLVKGIARLAGLSAPDVEGATGELHTNYAGKVEAALSALERHPFVAIHIEAPDELSHAGDLNGKLTALAYIDERVLMPLKESLDKTGDYRLLFMSDHATPVSLKTHTSEPVPYCLYDSSKPLDSAADAASHFDEYEAAKGPLIEGTKILARLMGL